MNLITPRRSRCHRPDHAPLSGNIPTSGQSDRQSAARSVSSAASLLSAGRVRQFPLCSRHPGLRVDIGLQKPAFVGIVLRMLHGVRNLAARHNGRREMPRQMQWTRLNCGPKLFAAFPDPTRAGQPGWRASPGADGCVADPLKPSRVLRGGYLAQHPEGLLRGRISARHAPDAPDRRVPAASGARFSSHRFRERSPAHVRPRSVPANVPPIFLLDHFPLIPWIFPP